MLEVVTNPTFETSGFKAVQCIHQRVHANYTSLDQTISGFAMWSKIPIEPLAIHVLIVIRLCSRSDVPGEVGGGGQNSAHVAG